jgi:hypothetical protein
MGGILSAFGGRPGGAAGGDLSGSYPNPVVAQSSAGTFTVDNTFTVDGTANLSSSNIFGDMLFQSGNGTNTAAAASVLAPTFANGAAAQLTDVNRDYMVYMECTTGGTALVVAIGPTATPANSIITSSTATLGELVSFRLPAGWFVKWSAVTAAFANQTAISC